MNSAKSINSKRLPNKKLKRVEEHSTLEMTVIPSKKLKNSENRKD